MKCICCSANIIADGFNPSVSGSEEEMVFSTVENHKAENAMWLGGTVGNISAGYGSDEDGSMFVIAICDKCTKDKMEDGTLAYIGDYMFGRGGLNKTIQDEYNEKYKKIWRRRNNIDKLL